MTSPAQDNSPAVRFVPDPTLTTTRDDDDGGFTLSLTSDRSIHFVSHTRGTVQPRAALRFRTQGDAGEYMSENEMWDRWTITELLVSIIEATP